MSVPDGKWLMLGGQILAESAEAKSKDNRILLILVRPRIVTGD